MQTHQNTQSTGTSSNTTASSANASFANTINQNAALAQSQAQKSSTNTILHSNISQTQVKATSQAPATTAATTICSNITSKSTSPANNLISNNGSAPSLPSNILSILAQTKAPVIPVSTKTGTNVNTSAKNESASTTSSSHEAKNVNQKPNDKTTLSTESSNSTTDSTSSTAITTTTAATNSSLSILLSKLPSLTATTAAAKSTPTNVVANAIPIATESTLAPVEKLSTNISTSKVEPLSKSAYDSLAPLNVPSKPVVYVINPKQGVTAAESVSQTETKPGQGQETNDSNSKTDAATSDTSDASRMDEKAKLESILMSSMSQTSLAYKQGGDGMSLNSRTLYKHSKFAVGKSIGMPMAANMVANSGPSIGSWVPRMPMVLNRLPPNYLCTICKTPGHLKSQCPEAVISHFKKIIKYKDYL